MMAVLALLFIGAAIAAAVPGATWASSGGISGRSESGCTCHGNSPSAGVQAEVIGLPDRYTAGQEYQLTVSVTGGPHQGGGFDLTVDRGTLAVADPNAQKFSDHEVGHNSPAATQWSVKWTAPDSGTATFYLATNSVNNNGDDTGDQWAKTTYRAASAAGGDSGDGGAAAGAGDLLWLPVFAAAGALASAAAIGYFRPPKAPAPLLKRPITAGAMRSTPHMAVFVVSLLLGALLTAPGVVAPGHGGSGGGAPTPIEPQLFTLTGQVTTQTPIAQDFDLDVGAPQHVVGTITWTDEADQARHQNLPDTLQLTVTVAGLSESAQAANPQGGEGNVTVDLDLTDAGLTADDKTVSIEVDLVNSGVQAAQPRGLGLRDRADGSNAFFLALNASYGSATAPSGGGGSGLPQAPAEPAPEPEFAAHAAVVGAGAALFVAALVSMMMLRGYVPAEVLPERMRPTRSRHAWLGALAVTLLGAAGAVGVATAVSEGMPFALHGILGLVVVTGAAAQGFLGYQAYRGKPTKKIHGLVAAAMTGALLGVALGGLLMFLG